MKADSKQQTNIVISGDSNEGEGLGKNLTLSGAVSLIVGCIIGTGVFSNGSIMLGHVGSPGMAMIIWVFGAFVAFAGGLSYTEWGLMITESGGDLPYLEFVYRKPRQLASFLYCFCRVILIHTGFTAALCTVVGQYAYRAFGLSSDNDTQKMWIEKCIGIVALVSIFALTAFSNAIATKAGTIITMIKIVIVTFVIACGIAAGAGAFSNLTPPGNFANAFEGTTTNPSKYADALYLVFFCYDGWSMLSTSVGELKDPVRNIPRAMVGGLSIVAVLYIGANFSYFLVLTREEIIQSKTLLASVYAEKMFGPTFAKVMSVLIMLSAYGSALCITFGASRVAFASAQRGFLPFSSILSKLHSRFQTPFTAIVFHCLLSLTLILITVSNDAFEMLIAMTGYPTWIFYGVTLAGLIIARFTHPLKERKFRVWLICPALIVLTAIFLSIFPFMNEKSAIPAGIGLGTVFLGSILYYFVVYRKQQL